MEKIFLCFVVILAIGVPAAWAHPFTLETVPAQFSNAPTGTNQVIVFYSEAVEIEFSDLQVFDGTGEQIDNKDTKYHEGEYSLVVSTPPLKDGAYTVTSKVLSKVDGHLVPSAFVFAIGDAKIDTTVLDDIETSELIFYPEAAARFPGFVGQTIVLGGVIASLLIWGTQNKIAVKDQIAKLEKRYHGKFLSVTGFGLILVFASNILMLVVQTLRLEASALEALQTSFGTTWIFRMIVTIVLLGVWFWMEKTQKLSRKNQIPLLGLALVLIGTTTMMGHGAASEQNVAVILDYVHNLVAAIWIGGIIFFVFTLLPSFGSLESEIREKMTLVSIPRFSIAFIIAIGVVIISGPLLMWFLESDVSVITQSTYGKLIIAKIAIAAVMVGLGGFFQLRIQKKAEVDLNKGKILIHKKMKRTLKIDVVLGVILLGVVALLANGTLPAGEIQKVQAQQTNYEFSTVEFSENIKFEIMINPLSSGVNSISVKIADFSGESINDFEKLKVKVANPQKNISPIEIEMNSVLGDNEISNQFEGEITFGFSGQWEILVEVQRNQNANESVILNLLVKPQLQDIKTEIIEYELPEEATPLYPVFDGDDSIWISDPSAPRIWRFSISDIEFQKYEYQGQTSITLTIDNQGKVWFTDIPEGKIGYLDPKTEMIQTFELPIIVPVDQNPIPISLIADSDDNIWITVTNKNVLLKFNQQTNEFEEFKIPTKESGPFALALDYSGNVWFSESMTGKIGVIDLETNEISEFQPEQPLSAPEAITFDKDGNLWIAEHTGIAITKFNPVLETFEQIPVPDQESLPFGMTFDRFGNLWFGQHVIDKLGAYDPENNNLIEIPIPTLESFVQFTTSDSKNNVWFVEQKGNKIGMVQLTEFPSSGPIIAEDKEFNIQYAELASPLVALGIIATSLFFVKGIHDKRRLNSLILN